MDIAFYITMWKKWETDSNAHEIQPQADSETPQLMSVGEAKDGIQPVVTIEDETDTVKEAEDKIMKSTAVQRIDCDIFKPWNCRYVIDYDFVGDDRGLFVPVQNRKEIKSLWESFR